MRDHTLFVFLNTRKHCSMFSDNKVTLLGFIMSDSIEKTCFIAAELRKICAIESHCSYMTL